MVHQSTQCESFYLQPMGSLHHSQRNGGALYSGSYASAPNICPETGSALRIGGPYWSGALHDQNVVDEILRRVTYGDNTGARGEGSLLPYPVGTSRRIQAVLASISEELKDVPFYYILSDLSANVHSKAPTKAMIKNALNNAGYRFSHFHHEPTSIKTDAPPSVIWDIMRQFCINNPPEGSKHKQQSLAAKSILSKDITTKIDFTYHSDNKFVLSQQGINDVLDNSNSLSYSLTHRNSLRNKIMDKKIAVAAGGNDCNDMSNRGSSSSRNRDKARFPMNPEKGWGPKRKALGKGGDDDDDTGAAGAGDGETSDANNPPKKRGRKNGDTGYVKGKGKEYYLALHAEKAEKVRAERAAARAQLPANSNQ